MIGCTGSSYVLADPLSDQLKTQQNQLQKDKDSLKKVQAEGDSLEMNIEKYDNQIEEILRDIDDNKKQINKSEDAIKNSENEIVKVESELNSEQDLFDDRMKTLYINGTNSYLEAILTSNSFGDFITKVDAIKRIAEFDNKIISDLNAKKEEVTEKKSALDAEKAKLVSIKTENEGKLAKLNSAKDEQNKQIQELKKQEKSMTAKVNESQALVTASLKQVEEIRKSAPKMNLSRGAAPISNNNVIAYATNYLGTPYKWGGTSPNGGFDCSGFTQYVYGHFGVNLGRTTYDQINNGAAVARSDLQPGDLVFFGSSSNPSHMGIYLGNNTYIHAPQTGDVVKISPMTRPDYVTARRVK